MDSVNLYVLTSLSIDAKGNVNNRNVGATFDIFAAEAHKAKGIESDFETFTLAKDWREDAEQSSLIDAMRGFRDIVTELQEAALR